MATAEQCEQGLQRLADRLAAYRDSHGDDGSTPDRTVRCVVRDLDLAFTGLLRQGRLTDIERCLAGGPRPTAQIRFELTGDDLLALVDGSLDAPAAWVSGRLKVSAGFRDLLRLRSFF